MNVGACFVGFYLSAYFFCYTDPQYVKSVDLPRLSSTSLPPNTRTSHLASSTSFLLSSPLVSHSKPASLFNSLDREYWQKDSLSSAKKQTTKLFHSQIKKKQNKTTTNQTTKNKNQSPLFLPITAVVF